MSSRALSARSTRELSREMKMFCISVEVVVTWVLKFVKTLYLKCVHFILCKLYLNTTFLTKKYERASLSTDVMAGALAAILYMRMR